MKYPKQVCPGVVPKTKGTLNAINLYPVTNIVQEGRKLCLESTAEFATSQEQRTNRVSSHPRSFNGTATVCK